MGSNPTRALGRKSGSAALNRSNHPTHRKEVSSAVSEEPRHAARAAVCAAGRPGPEPGGRHGRERLLERRSGRPGALDVVGSDTATPQLVSDLARGALTRGAARRLPRKRGEVRCADSSFRSHARPKEAPRPAKVIVLEARRQARLEAARPERQPPRQAAYRPRAAELPSVCIPSFGTSHLAFRRGLRQRRAARRRCARAAPPPSSSDGRSPRTLGGGEHVRQQLHVADGVQEDPRPRRAPSARRARCPPGR